MNINSLSSGMQGYPAPTALTPQAPPPPRPETAESLTRSAVTAKASVEKTAPVTGNTTESVPQADKKLLEEAAKATEAFVKSSMNSALEFKVDDESGVMVVKVMDLSTDQIIRQIPSEEMLQIARALGKLQGILVKSSA